MEDRKLVKSIFLIGLATFLLPVFVLAYSPDTTHRALSDETVDFFNANYPELALPNEEKELIKQGSAEEDEPVVRVLNHFYDPVYNVGLKSANPTSKKWAQNTKLQDNRSNFAGVGAVFFDYFDGTTDYSWERAIFDYAHKDKERGLKALGHILHLIQDASVPDHTRDDMHPPAFEFGSPYEGWARRWTPENFQIVSELVSERRRPEHYGTLGEYFDAVARYSNANFFSKDTIFERKYAGPNISYEKIEQLSDGVDYIFGLKEGSRIVRIEKEVDLENRRLKKKYFINDIDNLILSDYWKLLSREAVLNGAGVIKLFFDEVKKEEKTGVLARKNRPVLVQLLHNVKESVAEAMSTRISVRNEAASLQQLAAASVLSVSVGDSEVEPQSQREVQPQDGLDSRLRLPAQAGGNDREEEGNDRGEEENRRENNQTPRQPIGGQANTNNQKRESPSQAAAPPIKKKEVKPTTPRPSLEQEGRRDSATPVVAQTPRTSSSAVAQETQNPPPPATPLRQEESTTAQTTPQTTAQIPQSSATGQATPSAENTTPPSSSPQLGGGGDRVAVDESGRALPPPQAAVSQTTSASAGTTRRSSSQADTTAPEAPSIISPANEAAVATTAVTFSGTAEADSVISSDFSSATAIATSGAWTLSFTLSQGTTTVQFYATDAAGNHSTAGTVAVFVDSVAPSASLAATTCDSTLSSAACLVATTTLAFSWSSAASDVSYYRIDKNGTYSTTTTASISVGASDDGTYTFKVAAVDRYGNISATSTQQVEVYTRPIVINEVAWAGTNASSFDEWLELYNRTSRAISLANFTLYASDLSPYIPLSGTIGAGEYFLIERTDDTTVNNIAADLVTPFSGEGGSGLNNSGETLALALFSGGATTTVDTVATCSGGATSWCFGDDVFFRTMERYDASVAGSDSSNWYSHPGYIRNGTDANNANLNGTPRAKNAISYFIAPDGSLLSNKTLTAANSPYLVAGTGSTGLTVGPGITLTLDAGAVVKITSGNEPWIRVAGTIVANGTAASPVVFTSFYDDEYGGDMNGDGGATTPVAGSWARLLIDTTSVGSSFTNTLVRYGGNGYYAVPVAQRGAIGVDSATVSFDGLIVEKSNYYGLALENSNSTVTNSRFSTSTNSDAVAVGLYISGGSPSISSSTFSGNYRGLYITNATPTVTANSFVSNIHDAIVSDGTLGSFSGNSGSGNGKNAIRISSGTLATGGATTTLAVNDLPYLVHGTATVASGSTLAFNSGVIMKGWDSTSSHYGRISVQSGATLYSSGTTASDLVFTSMRDSSVGGTISSGLPAAAAGDWSGIEVVAGGRVNLSGFTLRYAGVGANFGIPVTGENAGAFKITGNAATSSGSIAHALFENNYQSGLNLDSVSSLSVSDTTFQNHTEEHSGAASAIYALNSAATFSSVTFSGNQRDATGSGTNTLTCTSCTPTSPNTSPANLFSP